MMKNIHERKLKKISLFICMLLCSQTLKPSDNSMKFFGAVCVIGVGAGYYIWYQCGVQDGAYAQRQKDKDSSGALATCQKHNRRNANKVLELAAKNRKLATKNKQLEQDNEKLQKELATLKVQRRVGVLQRHCKFNPDYDPTMFGE